MDDSEKLTALKKAYADTILNTAKEAAARIMVSERKALRYQEELSAVKEEALRMLLRLKEMQDFKVNAAEMESLSQKQRIDELEAQLGEAEDIVKDLRTELTELQDELDKVTKEKRQLLHEKSSRGETITSPDTFLDYRTDNLGTVTSSSPDTQPDATTTISGIENSAFNATYEIKKCCSKDTCYACNSDIASIITRGQKPELYRNGCTQRIRALGRSLSNGELSIRDDDKDNDRDDNVDNDRNENEDNDASVKVSDKSENISTLEENQDEVKALEEDEIGIQGHTVSPFSRKRKRGTRYSNSDQIVEMCQQSGSSDSETSQYAVNNINNTETVEDFQMIENTVEKDQECCPLTTSLSLDTNSKLGCEEITRESDAEVIKSCTEDKNEKAPIDNTKLRNQESESAENLDVKASDDVIEELSTPPARSRFIKYTFTRKRKRESLTSPSKESSRDDSTVKANSGEVQNGNLKSQKLLLNNHLVAVDG